ncbi:hypothetical protein LOTGIDRAFT_219231 [Lottia gigantea]|uniref:MIT domain-containing protein n=1 Tax=Lottia gigantea TaxID=225164 RepID=V4A0Q1_LOTGI|nr:hypothetical protein LOTGIDRAFT_219231 [Lottia gigantea]ESO88500.1 hypothetical protein LOTGIDRAFT_219231 [Lottia gigantea]
MSDVSKLAGIESSAISLLTRAVELDSNKRYEEAVTCYQEGLQLLLEVLKGTKDESKKHRFRDKIQEYMSRAEELKTLVKQEKEDGKYHEQIHIDNGSKGNSYEKLFSRFFDNNVTSVEIEDPYIRSTHQIYNLLRFCELVVKLKCPVRTITLTTSRDENTQKQEQNLGQVKNGLQHHGIELIIQYSTTLHDREIRLDTGWVIKIGRGLDIYKGVDKFAVGFCDFDLRPCHETTIDVFHRKNMKGS